MRLWLSATTEHFTPRNSLETSGCLTARCSTLFSAQLLHDLTFRLCRLVAGTCGSWVDTQRMFNGHLKAPISHVICYDLVDFWWWKMKQSHFQILHMEGFEGGEITVWRYAHFSFRYSCGSGGPWGRTLEQIDGADTAHIVRKRRIFLLWGKNESLVQVKDFKFVVILFTKLLCLKLSLKVKLFIIWSTFSTFSSSFTCWLTLRDVVRATKIKVEAPWSRCFPGLQTGMPDFKSH